MRLAIVGSRSIRDFDFGAHITAKPDLVVSGGAAGIDSLAEAWAKRNGIPTKVIRPDWARHGRSAGFKRNPVIVDNADEVLAVWDGTSRGTMHAVEYARSKGKPVRVVRAQDRSRHNGSQRRGGAHAWPGGRSLLFYALPVPVKGEAWLFVWMRHLRRPKTGGRGGRTPRPAGRQRQGRGEGPQQPPSWGASEAL